MLRPPTALPCLGGSPPCPLPMPLRRPSDYPAATLRPGLLGEQRTLVCQSATLRLGLLAQQSVDNKTAVRENRKLESLPQRGRSARQKRRQQKQIKPLVGNRTPLQLVRVIQPKITALQADRIKPPTQLLYLRSLHLLLAFLRMASLPTYSSDVWDQLLPEFLEYAFDVGVHRTTAAKAVSGLLWACPNLKQNRAVAFPATSAALVGWAKREPSLSRPPLPRAAMIAIVMWLVRNKHKLHAVAVLLMFEGYLRSAELLSLRAFQIVPPVRNQGPQFVAVLAVAQELQEVSKTGESDISISLDLQRQASLGRVLLTIVRHLSPMQKVWPFEYDELSRVFRAAASAQSVAILKPTLHSLRHGGASHDRWVGARSLLDVQSRGAWKQMSSVKRYDKHARLTRQLNVLEPAVRARLEMEVKTFERSFETFFEKP